MWGGGAFEECKRECAQVAGFVRRASEVSLEVSSDYKDVVRVGDCECVDSCACGCVFCEIVREVASY